MIESVTKSQDAIFITAPVLVPGEKDCDYCRGETPLSAKQVRDYAHSFSRYGFIEKDHDILFTKENVGVPVESYITPEPVTLKAVDGSTNNYPKGTWFLKSKITDKQTIERVLKGELNGYSLTALNKDDAEEYKIAMKESMGVLMKDLKNPVGFAVSLVKTPCVSSAKFCNVSKKGDNKMTNENEKKITDIVKKAFGLTPLDEKEKEYVTKADLDSALKEHTETITGIMEDYATKMSETVMKAKEDERKKKEEEEEETSGETENTSGEETEDKKKSKNNKSTSQKENGKTKGLPVGEKTPEFTAKSDVAIVMKAMNRDTTGRRLKKI